MAGARPSTFKSGGGFLNGVDGILANYQFTTNKPGTSTPSEWLYCELTVRVDGADDAVSTNLFVGSADDFMIEKGGHVLTAIDDNAAIGGKTNFGQFVTSLVAGGFPESELPEDTFDYSAILGMRARFVQVKDEAANRKLGKRVGKDGKEHDRTTTAVEKVYARGQSGLTPAKKVTTASGKPNGAAKTVDLDALTDETLTAILQKSDGAINKAKLPAQVAITLGAKHPHREDVRARMFSEDYLASAVERGLIDYDPSVKPQTITLLEA